MELVPLKNGKWLTVRPPVPDDAESLLALSRRVGGETDYLMTDSRGFLCSIEQEREYIAAVLADPKRFQMLGFIDGEPIGFFGVEPMGRGRAAHNASFGIAIVRSCWHLGIGAIFMAIATDFAKTAGYHKLCLDVRADNERAIKLYRRFGFSECGLRKEHLLINGEYFDEMIMELML